MTNNVSFNKLSSWLTNSFAKKISKSQTLRRITQIIASDKIFDITTSTLSVKCRKFSSLLALEICLTIFFSIKMIYSSFLINDFVIVRYTWQAQNSVIAWFHAITRVIGKRRLSLPVIACYIL